MTKQNKIKIFITTLITLLPVLIGIILWQRLPDEIAVHFSGNNTADRWCSKAYAVFALPSILAALHLVCLFFTSKDPKKGNIGKKPMNIAYWIIPVISLAVSSLIYAMALGAAVNVGFCAHLIIGTLFVVMGNVMPKAKQNRSFGLRLPWTVSDPENWNKTGRIAGWSLSVAGVVILTTSLVGGTAGAVIFIFSAAASVVIPTVCSFAFYKRSK